MSCDRDHELIGLLEAWNRGDRQAVDELTSLVYEDLRRMAKLYLSRERSGHPWQSTDLVHELFLKLFEQEKIPHHGRYQFFAFAGHLMRRALIDHARYRHRDKRGGGTVRIPFEETVRPVTETTDQLLALDQALRDLAVVDPEKSAVVQLHFFAGLSVAETAAALDCSEATITRRWRGAKSWLHRELDPRPLID